MTRGGPHQDEAGASSVEYGLMIAGIAGLIVAATFIFGGFVTETFAHNCGIVRDQVGLADSCR